MNPALKLILPGDVEMKFQSIPAGTFRMGSRGYYDDEEPVHRVQITTPFYLGTYPVTQEQFVAFKPDHKNHFADRPNHPAESMTWHDAVAFCEWLSAVCADTLPRDYRATLPTEAHWEYACRAGTETEYYSGDGESALAEVGWYGGTKGSTQAVGQLEPNSFGLHDMHGNVDEWCVDAWDEHAYKHRVDGVCDPVSDGEADADRVFRGGAWNYSPRICRSAFRYWRWSSDVSGRQGFRVCLVAGPSPARRAAEPVSGGVARRDDAAKPQ